MDTQCIFCQIIRGEKPADVLHQDDHVIVLRDIHPHAPVHLLIVTKRHIRSLNDLTGEDKDILCHMLMTAREMAERQGISARGYKLIFNVERGGGQVVFHLHMHLLGGW